MTTTPDPPAPPDPPASHGRPAPRDPGLPAERTRLAWRRTALAGTAVALLAVRFAMTELAGPAAAILVALGLFGWLALLGVAFRRLRAMGPGWPPPVARGIGAAVLTVGYAMLGLALLLARAR